MKYYRVESESQPTEVALKQEEEGEIWGAAAWGSETPKVKAYVGELPAGVRGVEFTTDTPPDPGCPPGQAFWSGPRPGVEVVENYAKIRVTVTRNTQT